MVRAAASGAFNYERADPYNKQWRIRHSLVLREVVRSADESMLAAAHQHWLAYVSHPQLEPDSWKNVKQKAADTLTELSNSVYAVNTGSKKETGSPEDTIYAKYGNLIDSYRAMVANENAQKKAD
jgi:hypothetical protein